MKILFFIESLESGGKERRLVELLKKLVKYQNFEIELVLTRKGITFEEVFDLNIKVHFIERRHFKKDPGLFYQFFKIAKAFRPDVIHVWGNMVAIYAIPAKVLLNVPMINNQITDAPEKVYSGLLGHKIPFSFSDLIISNSKAGIKAYKSPREKSLVVYNGFNSQRVMKLKTIDEIKSKFSIVTKYVVGMVASFTKLKDYGTYINAANLILRSNNDITFLCVGAGDDSEFRGLVNKDFKDKIVFTGKQNDVESIMNCCDIGVLSTFTEGISNSAMEFMALGKPMVVTGGGGTEELIENNVCGIIIESGKPELLAEKIHYLLNNSGIALEMGDKAKERIENQFNIDKMVDAYLSVYQSFQQQRAS